MPTERPGLLRPKAAAPRRALAAALALVLAAPAIAQRVDVVDDAGRRVSLPGPAQRVVAVAPHLVELAFAAGGAERVVGVVKHSDFPPPAARLPQVGDAFTLNLEAIAALKPDLVLVWGSGLNERHKAQLRALRLPVYESEIASVEGVARTLQTLGRLMGTSAQADAQAARLRQRWQALQARYAGRAPVRVFYQVWAQPLMTVSRSHVIHELLQACGGVNPFAALPQLTPTVGWEAALRADPQLIIGTAGPDGRFEPGRWLEFTQVEAVRERRFAAVDASLVSRMGPRLVDGAEQLCEAIDRARP